MTEYFRRAPLGVREGSAIEIVKRGGEGLVRLQGAAGTVIGSNC